MPALIAKPGPARSRRDAEFAPAPPRSLAATVRAAARRLDAGLAEHSRTLLALVSCFYAQGIFGSAQIEKLLRRLAGLDRLVGDLPPDAAAIRRFRSEHREALQFCLQAALRFLAEEKIAAGVVTRICDAQLAEEARRRIITAMFADSLELDGEPADDPPGELGYLFAKGAARVH